MALTLETALIWYARHFPVTRGKMRIVDAVWPIAVSRSETQRMAHLIYGGYKAPCDIKEMIQRQLYFFGTYYIERDLLGIWSLFARHARIVFDIGANAGIYSLAALAANPASVVHAFEPTPEIATRLRATAVANDLVHLQVHQLAVLDQVGTASLTRCRGENDSNEGMNFVRPGVDQACEIVECTNLDHFCVGLGIAHVDLIKLDIQGQELTVLRGALNLLDREALSTIFMELNWAPARSPSCPASEAVELLDSYDFRFADPKSHLSWRKAGPWLRGLTDVVARHAKTSQRSRGSCK